MWEGLESWAAQQAAELKAHREAGGLVVYRAEIARMESCGEESIEWYGHFSTPEKAEVAIAVEQARFGTEDKWESMPSGNSIMEFCGGLIFEAGIYPVMVQ